MNRPDNLMAYDELDLKLGIKSSLPHVKGTLALSVLLWECADHPSELVFSEQKDKETVLTQELRQWLSDYLSEICEEENIDIQKVISCANDNQLFKSQMEALIVLLAVSITLRLIQCLEPVLREISTGQGHSEIRLHWCNSLPME